MTIKPSILIIENNNDHSHQSLAPVLYEAGYMVASARPTAGVARLAIAWPCDLILIDIDEQDSKGSKLAAEIHRQSPEMSVLLLARRPVSKNFLLGQDNWIFDSLVTPIEPIIVLDSVAELLSHRLHTEDLSSLGW